MLFVVTKSHLTFVWCWVHVTMVIHDFRDARRQWSLCHPWLLFTLTTDGYANQTGIIVCLLPLHYQHMSLNVRYHISYQDKWQAQHPTPPRWHLLPCSSLSPRLSADCGKVVSLQHILIGDDATSGLCGSGQAMKSQLS